MQYELSLWNLFSVISINTAQIWLRENFFRRTLSWRWTMLRGFVPRWLRQSTKLGSRMQISLTHVCIPFHIPYIVLQDGSTVWRSASKFPSPTSLKVKRTSRRCTSRSAVLRRSGSETFLQTRFMRKFSVSSWCWLEVNTWFQLHESHCCLVCSAKLNFCNSNLSPFMGRWSWKCDLRVYDQPNDVTHRVVNDSQCRASAFHNQLYAEFPFYIYWQEFDFARRRGAAKSFPKQKKRFYIQFSHWLNIKGFW